MKDKQGAIDRLKEIKDEIEELISEAREVLKGAIGRDSAVYARANAYWLPMIEGTLEGRACMYSMQNTIDELEAEGDIEEEEEGDADFTKEEAEMDEKLDEASGMVDEEEK